MCGVSAAGGFSDVQCQGAHAVDIGDVLQTAKNGAQVGGDGSLQGEQGEGVTFGLGGLNHEVVVVADHGFSQDDVCPEKGLGRLLHRGAGEPAHIADAARECVELLMKRRTHIVNGRPQQPATRLVRSTVQLRRFSGIRDVVELRVGLGDLVARMVAFIRAGYPQGVPETDYVPLLALLRRRLSDDEVAAVATQLAARGEMNIDAADIGVAITRITDELPSQADLDRVQRRLETIGWPVDPDR